MDVFQEGLRRQNSTCRRTLNVETLGFASKGILWSQRCQMCIYVTLIPKCTLIFIPISQLQFFHRSKNRHSSKLKADFQILYTMLRSSERKLDRMNCQNLHIRMSILEFQTHFSPKQPSDFFYQGLNR